MEDSRIDLYTLPHKVLRHALCTAGTALAREGRGAVALVVEAIDALVSHGEHEDAFIHPLVARHLPDVELELRAQHTDLHVRIDGMRRLLDAIATGDDGPEAVLRGYRTFQRMVAWNLGHLDHEEALVMPALWAAAPPGALADLMAAFRAAHPDAIGLYRRWPDALAEAERARLGIAA